MANHIGPQLPEWFPKLPSGTGVDRYAGYGGEDQLLKFDQTSCRRHWHPDPGCALTVRGATALWCAWAVAAPVVLLLGYALKDHL